MSDGTNETKGDVLDLLMDEHRQVQSMIEQLAMQSHQEEDPRELADIITADLVRHSVAEEMYIYPAIREYLTDGEREVQHDIDEHQQILECLKDLENLQPADGRFTEVVAQLQALVDDHVRDEEDDQFPRLREVIPEEKLIELRGKVETAEKLAPTRPHPSAPHSELFHKVVGPGVGMVDRMRDAMSGRMAS